jgi:hypothetical protein
MPSISTSQISPGFIKTGGIFAYPTPAGVPVITTSPGSKVMHSVMRTRVSATPHRKSVVLGSKPPILRLII